MNPFIIHVTFDCVDPDRVARFWAEALGYAREDSGRADVVGLRSPDGRGVRRLLFFRVPEGKTGKNRVHVDLAARDPRTEIDRLVELGATRGEHVQENGRSWTVMLDPEHNEFCIG